MPDDACRSAPGNIRFGPVPIRRIAIYLAGLLDRGAGPGGRLQERNQLNA
jgi:hypothetical protein